MLDFKCENPKLNTGNSDINCVSRNFSAYDRWM